VDSITALAGFLPPLGFEICMVENLVLEVGYGSAETSAIHAAKIAGKRS